MIDRADPAAVRLAAAWRLVRERASAAPPMLVRETADERAHLAILADALGISVLELRRRGVREERARDRAYWRRTVA